jgi:hypothetical protein
MSLDPGDQPVTQKSGRTLVDYLEDYLARPDVAEQIKPAAVLFVECLKVWGGVFQMAWTITQRAIKLAPSIAYESLLIEQRIKPVWARRLASLTICRGTREANESLRLTAVVRAIRFLAKPGCGRRAVFRRAEVLLAAWEKTSIIETIFDGADLSESEFIGLLKSVVEGREIAWGRITEIAAVVAPLLSVPRGPKISAASAAHQLLLEELVSVTRSQGYTWDPYKGDFSDPLTQATRLEFACPRFSPQPARRRLRRRRAIIDGSGCEACGGEPWKRQPPNKLN